MNKEINCNFKLIRLSMLNRLFRIFVRLYNLKPPPLMIKHAVPAISLARKGCICMCNILPPPRQCVPTSKSRKRCQIINMIDSPGPFFPLPGYVSALQIFILKIL